MTAREKLYFLIDTIDDLRVITPNGEPIKIHATHHLNNKYRGDELDMIFTKLEKDEKILEAIKDGNRVKEIGSYYGLNERDDGHYHLKLLPLFDTYFLKTQYEPEYQKFTGKVPPSVQIQEDNESYKEKELYEDTSVEIVIADLESLYEEISEEKDRVQFFTKTASYGRNIDKNKHTANLLGELRKGANMDADDYRKAWKKFIDIWKEYASDLLLLAAKAGIEEDVDSPNYDNITAIKAKLNESEVSLWESDLSSFYTPYQRLIWKFKEVGKERVLVPKHAEPSEGQLMLYPHYIDATNAWSKFKNIRQSKAWWAHYQIVRLGVGVFGDKEKEQYFKRDNIIDSFYKFEFEEVARGNINRSPIVLHEHKYRTWIKRLHKYLLPRLKSLEKSAKKEIDYSDNAARRALEKKWDVLQVVWDVYEAHSRPDSIFIPIGRLVIKNRSEEFIDGVIDGFKRLGLFENWSKHERHYDIQKINHNFIPKYYEEVKAEYGKYSESYQSRENNKVSMKKRSLLELKLSYDKETHKLKSVDGKECQIPPNINEDYIAIVMFKKKKGEPIDWSIIYEELSGDEPMDDKSRTIYDAMNALNKRIMEHFDTDEKMFEWQRKNVIRKY